VQAGSPRPVGHALAVSRINHGDCEITAAVAPQQTARVRAQICTLLGLILRILLVSPVSPIP
jgi:hypothetical protein